MRLGCSSGEGNNVVLDRIDMGTGETFCHTNHFQDEDQNKSLWVYEDETESPERLRALQEAVKSAVDPTELEGKFMQFLNDHPNDLSENQLLDVVSGIFSFNVGHTGVPYVRSIIFPYGWGL